MTAFLPLKTVMCLGACDRAPMLQCNLKFHENLDEAKFDALIDRLRSATAGRSLAWPHILLTTSDVADLHLLEFIRA